MKKAYLDELDPVVREKMKKNVVYLSIFSIVMLFAGFTSAYIVSMGDAFWVKYDFPPAFYISTGVIALSSLVYVLTVKQAKKASAGGVRVGLFAIFALGLAFIYFQFKGYGQLVDQGAHGVAKIMVSDGRYGTYYELKVNDKFMEVDGNKYLIGGKEISPALKTEISEFAKQLVKIPFDGKLSLKNYGKFTLVYKNNPIVYINGQLKMNDSTDLKHVDFIRLEQFSWHLRDGRGDFFHRGELGKDFHIYYKGKELAYKNKNLVYNGTKLDTPMQLKMESAADHASSYLYIITFLHLLHIAATLIYLLRLIIRSFTGTLERYSYISLRLGGIFWHFLGVLWLYLLCFLLFIH